MTHIYPYFPGLVSHDACPCLMSDESRAIDEGHSHGQDPEGRIQDPDGPVIARTLKAPP